MCACLLLCVFGLNAFKLQMFLFTVRMSNVCVCACVCLWLCAHLPVCAFARARVKGCGGESTQGVFILSLRLRANLQPGAARAKSNAAGPRGIRVPA